MCPFVFSLTCRHSVLRFCWLGDSRDACMSKPAVTFLPVHVCTKLFKLSGWVQWCNCDATMATAITRRSQHPRVMFCVPRDHDLWPFNSEINGFLGLIVEHFCVKFGDSRDIGFWDIVWKKTKKHKRHWKTLTTWLPSTCVRPTSHLRFCRATLSRDKIASVCRTLQLLSHKQELANQRSPHFRDNVAQNRALL